MHQEGLSASQTKTALKLNTKDNVAIALTDLAAGDVCRVREDHGETGEVGVLEDVAFGHKVALADLAQDAPVVKYGEEIGRAGAPVRKGGWIHTHNLYCDRGMK